MRPKLVVNAALAAAAISVYTYRITDFMVAISSAIHMGTVAGAFATAIECEAAAMQEAMRWIDEQWKSERPHGN